MPGLEDKPPAREEREQVRQRALNKVEEEGLDNFLPEDVEKIRNNDHYVDRFWMHVFDQPGSQLDEAVAMVIKALKWRKTFGVHKLGENSLNRKLLDQGAFYSHGRDKGGKKLMVLVLKNNFKGENLAEMKKILVYWFERLEREEEGKMISWVFDCKGAGLKNMDLELINFIIECMEHYFPYILNLIYIFEMPWLMNAGFRIVKAALPAAGVAKLRDVTKKDFDKFVDDDNRLVSWGGGDDWEFEFEPEVLREQPERRDESSFSSENQYEDPSEIRMTQNQHSYISSTPSSVSRMSNLSFEEQDDSGGLLRVSPSPEIPFSPSGRSADELVGSLRMTNVSSMFVAYKLKTTSPDMFRVRPSTGAIAPGQAVQVEIRVAQGGGISREKFLISAVRVERQPSSSQEIKAALKRGKPESEYRLRCILSRGDTKPVLSNGSPMGPGKPTAGVQDDMKKEAAKMIKKINDLAEKMENLENQVTLCLYGIAGLLGSSFLLLVILLFFNSCPSPAVSAAG